ncbi:oligoribonuclease [Candidatus Hartigia pinicola]
MKKNKNHLIWIDLEMTGLDPDLDRIIEIATIVTNSQLNILAQGPVIAIHTTTKQLELMNAWNINTHISSGLVKRIQNSTFSVRDAELETIKFLRKWVIQGTSPMCGNSIAQDRRFLFRYMPELESYFHYRYLDVSTLKELARLWKPEILAGYTKKNTHQALNDIQESISELAYYRKTLIKENS